MDEQNPNTTQEPVKPVGDMTDLDDDDREVAEANANFEEISHRISLLM